MERKLVQHGPKSLGISVPARWIREQGLSKGDSVAVTEDNEGRILIEARPQQRLAEAHINAGKMSETLLRKTLHRLYEEGYCRIVVSFEKPVVRSTQGMPIPLKERLTYLAGRLIGLELIGWSTNEAELQVIISESSMSLHHVMRKAFLMTEEFMKVVENALGSTDGVDTYQEMHDSITKFVCLGKRQIRLNSTSKQEYLVLVLIDKVADHLRILCENFPLHITASSKDHMVAINESFRLFSKGYWSRDRSLLNACLRKRKDVYDGILAGNEGLMQALLYAGMLETILLLVENCGLSVIGTGN